MATKVDSAFQTPFNTPPAPRGTQDNCLGYAADTGVIKPVQLHPLNAKPGPVEGAMKDMLVGSNPKVDQYSPIPSTTVETSFDAPFKTRK